MSLPQPSAGQSPSVSIRRQNRLRAAVCEVLETRSMLSVSLGSDGYTNIGASSDTRTIHVSSSDGSDSNNGSSDRPVKSIAKGISLLRDNAPDHLLLKRGDSWRETIRGFSKSGRSQSEPLVFGAYGSGNRPLIKTGASTAFDTSGDVDHLAIMGVHFWADKREPGASGFSKSDAYGIRFVASTESLLIEDTVVDQYKDNVLVQDYFGTQRNVKIRRSIITDAWSSSGKAQGLYATGANGLTLEENVFDHNGWNSSISGAGSNALSHNAYIAADTNNLVVKGNVFADAASHGLQARPGGEIKNNLFLRNPIGMSYGVVNGAPLKPGGVTGTVEGNVFLDSRDISGAARGWAIEMGNIKSANVRNNIMSDDGNGNSGALFLGYGNNVLNSSQGVGINNLVIEDNIVHDWYRSMDMTAGLRPGGSGFTSLNNLTVRDNDFQYVDSPYGQLISHSSPTNSSEEHWSNNRYYEDISESKWYTITGRGASLSTWKSRVESTADSEKVSYANPDADIASYQRSIGGTASLSGFMSSARKLGEGKWASAFTAQSVINYIRGAFNQSPESNEDPVDESDNDDGDVVQDTRNPRLLSYNASATGIKLRFDENVSGSLSTSDLMLKNTSTGRSISASAMKVTYNTSTNEATWSFPGLSDGRLPDGNYKAQFPDQYITDLADNRLGGGSDIYISFSAKGEASGEAPSEPAPNEPEPNEPSGGPSVVGYSGSSTSVKIRFSKDVSASLTAKDLGLRHTTRGNVVYDSLKLSYNHTTNEATWTWSNLGRLVSGKWEAKVLDQNVTDSSGQRLTGGRDFVFTFYA